MERKRGGKGREGREFVLCPRKKKKKSRRLLLLLLLLLFLKPTSTKPQAEKLG